MNLENQNTFHGKSDLERNIFTQFYVTTVWHSLHIHTSPTEMFLSCLLVSEASWLSLRIILCPRSANYELLKLWAQEQRDKPLGRNMVQIALKQLQTKGQAVHLISKNSVY